MTTEPEWGPWIEHDGKGCPVPDGTLVNAVWDDEDESYFVQGENKWFETKQGGKCNGYGNSGWIIEETNTPYDAMIIRYRIRKPRAMKLLQSIAENPPKQLIKEDA